MAGNEVPNFADAFAPADEAQWRALVARVLKGAPFETLVSRTADDIAIEPLYARSRQASPRALRAAAGAWAIAARVDHPDPREANRLALADLEGGANALHLVMQGAVGAYGFGLPCTGDALQTALDGVHLDLGVKIELDMSAQSCDCADALARICEARKIEPGIMSVSFGFDPLSQCVLRGGARATWPKISGAVAIASKALMERGFTGGFCVADGRVVHASGGSEAQELAYVVSAALAYWRAFETSGVDFDAARAMLSFRMAADADEFLSLAKFRALRLLWARVEDAAGLTPKPIHLHAETAWRMMTQRDPYANLLRATMACFSAGLGGADVVSVLPFTQALGLPDDLARRIARNTQLLLLEESSLGRVADPAAGSGVFEAMTSKLCEKAWELVQDIERSGGLFAALAAGRFQADVAAAREKRQALVATRRAQITGTSSFPDAHEAPVDVIAPMPHEPRPAPCALPFAALAPMRDAQPFERLRDRADELAKAGARPKVFLGNLGPFAAYSARAIFAKGLFESGGFDVIDEAGFDEEALLIAAFQKSGAALVCLCSSDEIYGARAAQSVRALIGAGARQVWVCGRADDQAEITGFVYSGCDAIAVLTSAQSCL
jgi:methylmalonyl-CoA mutase